MRGEGRRDREGEVGREGSRERLNPGAFRLPLRNVCNWIIFIAYFNGGAEMLQEIAGFLGEAVVLVFQIVLFPFILICG